MIRTTTFFFAILLLVAGSVASGQSNGRGQLRRAFDAWKNQQLETRVFWGKDSCNMAWYNNHETGDVVGLGFPDPGKFTYHYADLNNDGTEDQLVSFYPVQCDGGIGMMWVQVNVLTLSQGATFTTVSDLNNELFSHFQREKDGFYLITGIAVNQVKATYYAYRDDDMFCCPSIEKPVVFQYRSGVLLPDPVSADAGRKELFLGSVLCDSASVKDYSGNMPDMEPILNSTNKIEIRFVTVHFGDHDEVIVLSLDDTWSVSYVQGNKQTPVDTPVTFVPKVDPEELFARLVENKIFSLPDSRSLTMEQLTIDPGTGMLSGKGLGISDPTHYVIEYKVGPYFRRYSYANPRQLANFHPAIDELQYFAAIMKLMDQFMER